MGSVTEAVGAPLGDLKNQVGVRSSWRNYLPVGSTRRVGNGDSMAVNHNQSINLFSDFHLSLKKPCSFKFARKDSSEVILPNYS